MAEGPETRDGADANLRSMSRSRAALVAGISGLALPGLLLTTLFVVGSYVRNYVPGIDAPSKDFVRFYSENFSKIRVSATLDVWSSVLLLVFFVAVVRAVPRRFPLLEILAVVFAAASTAVNVAGRALFASPTLVVEMTGSKIGHNLDPGVARTLIFVPDTMSAVGGVLFGFALLALAVMLFPSDLVGRRFLAVTAGLLGVVGVFNLLLGGAGGFITVVVWAVPAAILMLVSASRINPDAIAGNGRVAQRGA